MVPGHVPGRGQSVRCKPTLALRRGLGKRRIPGARAPPAAATAPWSRENSIGQGMELGKNNLLRPAQLSFSFQEQSVKAKVFKQWAPGSRMIRAPSRKKKKSQIAISSAETIEVIPCWGCIWCPLSFLLRTWVKPLKKTHYSVRKTNAFEN